MAYFSTQTNAFTPDELATMHDGLTKSAHLGKSQLVGGFRQTRGFGIAFTKIGIPRVRNKFPVLAPFLELVLSKSSFDRVQPRWRSLLPKQQSNAFYINVLLLPEHAAVTRHVDATLQGPSGLKQIVPRSVTVAYLCVPKQSSGGILKLFANHLPLAAIHPEPGMVVQFRGNLGHEISEYKDAKEPRLSLVCEQYVFSRKTLARLPEFQIQSRALDPIFSRNPAHATFGHLLAQKMRFTDLS